MKDNYEYQDIEHQEENLVWDVARFEDNKDTFVLAKATIDRELSYNGAID